MFPKLLRLKFSPALDQRLTELLDRQDRDGKLSAQERREAEALVEVAEFCTLLKLTAANSIGRK
ncbi:MAG: hypothetical protein IAF94_15240 [Pirellulaceae bacterium]|nr:hypothetical protein [Pirellulaceae bacterium]